MKVTFVTTYDLAAAMANQRVWANPYLISNFTANALQDCGLDVTYVHDETDPLFSRLLAWKQTAYLRLGRKHYMLDRSPRILRGHARRLMRKLDDADFDLIFSPSTLPIAFLECRQPIVFWTDATFDGMVDFYPTFSNLCAETLRNGHAIEQAALDRATLAIYTSDWAAQTAVEHYDVDPAKIHVVPRGAPIAEEPELDDVEAMIAARTTSPCKLLFIGNSWWKRKGGDIAVAVAAELNRYGLATELTVVGYLPAMQESFPPFVRFEGFVSKATPQGRARMQELISESHFLILPARAEASANVFAEASAYGVPSIATDVGGNGTAVRDGVNGKLFPADTRVEEYVAYILEIMADQSQYRNLALFAYEEYQRRLNWRVVGQHLVGLIEQVTAI